MKHRTAIVSALSIAGVVVAGATALGANLGILRSSSDVGALSSVADPPASTTTLPGVASETVAYQVVGVGIVTLARTGDRLQVASVESGDWAYQVIRQGERVQIGFVSGNRLVDFEARVEDSVTRVSVGEEDILDQMPGVSTETALPLPGSVSSRGVDGDDVSTHQELEHEGFGEDD